VLLVSLLATLGALLGILDDDGGRRFPNATWGWVKLGHLIANNILSGDTAQLLGGVLDGVDRCLKRSYQRHIACAASRHLSPWPLRVMVVFPPTIGLMVAQVPCTPLRLCTHLTGPPARRGLDMWASTP
jgi:hypothetical protein